MLLREEDGNESDADTTAALLSRATDSTALVAEPALDATATTVDDQNAADEPAKHATKGDERNNNDAGSVVHDGTARVNSPRPKARAVPVAPMPLACVQDFQFGKVLAAVSTDTTPPPARGEEEESYIPVALAKAHLAKVVADMHAMKDEQALKVAHIMAQYKAIEEETQVHYESRLSDLRNKAKRKIQDEKRKLVMLASTSAEKDAQAQREKQALQELYTAETAAHNQQREQWRERLERCLQAHEDAMTHCHVLVALELRRETQVHEHDKHTALEQLRNELFMTWEDAKSESMRAMAQLTQLRKEVAVKEKAFVRRVHTIQAAFETERETHACLDAVVNRVVDMAQQATVQRETRALATHIKALEQVTRASVERESRLERQLAQARERFAAVERAAVGDALECVLQALELAPVVTPRMTSTAETMTTVPLTATTDSQTDPGDGDGKEDTDKQTGADAFAALTLAQLEYKSQVERTRELSADVLRSKAHLKAEKAELETLLAKKNAAKGAIKTWLAEFQRAHSREPAIEDKAQVKDLYLLFKATEEAYNAKKHDVAQLKSRHHSVVVKVEAVAQWQALSDSTIKSSTRATEATAIDEDDTSRTNDSRPASSSSSFSSSVSDSRPVSRDTTSALEREVERLRQELARVTKAREAVDAEMHELDREPSSVVHDVQSGGTMETVLSASVVDRSERIGAAPEASEPNDAARVEAERQREDVADELEKQRTELQTTIADLIREIEARKAEKATLETHIEQLRLHLELMELNGDSDDSCLLRSGGKQQTSTNESTGVKRRASQSTFFDDEEDAESSDDDGDSEVRQSSDGSRATLRTREALDDADVDESDVTEDDNGGDDDFETEADAKDAVDSQDSESPGEKEDFMSCLHLVAIVRDAVEHGRAQFNCGDRAKCYQTYLKASDACVDELKRMHASRRDEVAGFQSAASEASRLPPARGCVVLRKQLDALLADCEQRLKARDERRKLELERVVLAAAAKPPTPQAKAAPKRPLPPQTPGSSPSKKPKAGAGSHTKATPSDAPDVSESVGLSPPKTPAGTTIKAVDESKQKLKALEARAKADKVRITQLENALAKAESQLATTTTSSASSGGGAGNTAALERKVADLEKKHKHALEDAEKSLKKDIATLTQQLQAAQTKTATLQDQSAQAQKELAVLGSKASQLVKLEDEVAVLKTQAATAAGVSEELAVAKTQLVKLEASYKEEQLLRKKYYNQIEDMKGKIRVFARCRPMSSSELERGCVSCVTFTDEYALELETARGPKPFAFDQVFSPASSQDAVFEDTKNLMQSALDGYNVCIFAYGQTGSGKTFTMTGSDALPGLTPRAIAHLYGLADEARSNYTITFYASMLELYNDTLIDLLHLVDAGHDRESAVAAGGNGKLEIKKNDKGMVFVQNAVVKACASPHQALKLFESANKKRQVGSTKMNAESSRSHSVFSLLVESYNKTTKATTTGKLSLVDLAGSERAGKTGATAERLKEAQAINKSLSALGDVISALSTNEKFIPYRNNKLTQLMQDSLGGNAKTLMFVNISPADYNQEETQTSLAYASRVKLITNNANKNSESELVNRLKHIIKQLKAGKTDVELDGVLE